MKKQFNSALVQLSDEFVSEQHSGVPLDNIEASGQDEHRSELDGYVQVKPIEGPDFLGGAQRQNHVVNMWSFGSVSMADREIQENPTISFTILCRPVVYG